MKKFFELNRIFWTCKLIQGVDLYYYYEFTNWFTHRRELVFAGYYAHALNRKSTGWLMLKEKIK